MATVKVTADGNTGQKVLSMHLVRAYTNGSVGMELPYYATGHGAQCVTLELTPYEALELATHLVNTVNHELLRQK